MPPMLKLVNELAVFSYSGCDHDDLGLKLGETTVSNGSGFLLLFGLFIMV